MNENNKPLERELLEEEYMLGKEYYDKILESAKEDITKKYK